VMKLPNARCLTMNRHVAQDYGVLMMGLAKKRHVAACAWRVCNVSQMAQILV
jgi:hypothetical protein